MRTKLHMEGKNPLAARQWHSLVPCRLPFVIQKATARQGWAEPTAILAAVQPFLKLAVDKEV